jgi:hypothetical protein
VKVHRFVLLVSMAGLLGGAAVAPSAGCNGTGVTPNCDFADGAPNPESGCGELVEAAPPPVDAPSSSDVVEEPVPIPADGGSDSGDATAPADSSDQDVHPDAQDSGGADAKDAEEDVKDANVDHKG